MVFASSPRFARIGLTAGLLALTTLGGCAQDQDILTVQQAIWFTDDDNCTLTGSEAPPLTMTVDVSFDTRIGMGFLVSNNQSQYGGSNTGIDDTEVEIESAEVSLSFSGGSIEGGSFTQTMPSNSLSGGDSAAFLVQVPTSVVASMRASMTPGQFETLEMEVVFKGRKYGQAGDSKLGEIEARAYTFPFDVCLGCLANCDCGTCPTATEWAGGTCGFAQGLSIYYPTPECKEGTPTTTDTGTDTGP